MPSVALTGNDTIVINDRLLNDLADGDAVMMTYPDDIAAVKVGKNGNSLYSLNTTGKRAEVVIRVIRGSADDKYLNNLLTQMQANFAGFILMTGEFIKKVGNGQGQITNDTYVMSGGIFTKQVEAKSNVEGDTEQSVAIYTLNYSNSPRAIG